MLKGIDYELAHEFCSQLYNLDKETEGNALLHLEEMLTDYSPNTNIKSVLQDLSDRIYDFRKYCKDGEE